MILPITITAIYILAIKVIKSLFRLTWLDNTNKVNPRKATKLNKNIATVRSPYKHINVGILKYIWIST